MTADERNKIIQMRQAGMSYKQIAEILGKKLNTIKTFCNRNGLTMSANLENDMVFPGVSRCLPKILQTMRRGLPSIPGSPRENVLLRRLPEQMVECAHLSDQAPRHVRIHMSGLREKVLRLQKPEKEVLLTSMLYHRSVRSFVMKITEDEFNQEMHYQIMMYFVRLMLREALISEDEFFKIEMRNRERYKPFIGILLSGKFLLLSSRHVDAFIARKVKNRHEKSKFQDISKRR